MKPAVIFSIPTPTAHGYSWRWRSVDNKADSQKQFHYYHECLADARASGYSVQLTGAHGSTAPGWGAVATNA